MQHHYLYQVSKSLPEHDYTAFCTQLKKEGKERSLVLVKTLRRCDNSITKELLYEKAFKKKYQPDKDFLIRNEFRLLKKLLEDYLVQKEAERELKENAEWRNRLLGNVLVRHQLPNVAIEYLKKAGEAASQNLHHDLAFELNLMTFPLEYLSAPDQEALYALMERNITSNHALVGRTTAFRLAQVGFQASLLNLLGKELGKPPIPLDALHIADATAPPEARYYNQKAKAYASYSIEDMELLSQLSQQLPENPLTRNERITALVQLATICSIHGQFERAAGIFETAYQSPDFPILKEKPSFYINYITNLLKLGQYADALLLIQAAEPLAMGANLRNKLDAAHITCHIFLKNTQQLRVLLPNDLSGMDDVRQHYYKLLYAIYFYLDGQTEMALRELENLVHTRHIQAVTGYLQLAKLMAAVFRLLHKEAPLGKPRQATLDKVKQLVAREKVGFGSDVQGLLPFIWLEHGL